MVFKENIVLFCFLPSELAFLTFSPTANCSLFWPSVYSNIHHSYLLLSFTLEIQSLLDHVSTWIVLKIRGNWEELFHNAASEQLKMQYEVFPFGQIFFSLHFPFETCHLIISVELLPYLLCNLLVFPFISICFFPRSIEVWNLSPSSGESFCHFSSL